MATRPGGARRGRSWIAACAPASGRTPPGVPQAARAAADGASVAAAVGRARQASGGRSGTGHGRRLMPVERSIQSAAVPPKRAIARPRSPPWSRACPCRRIRRRLRGAQAPAAAQPAGPSRGGRGRGPRASVAGLGVGGGAVQPGLVAQAVAVAARDRRGGCRARRPSRPRASRRSASGGGGRRAAPRRARGPGRRAARAMSERRSAARAASSPRRRGGQRRGRNRRDLSERWPIMLSSVLSAL